VDFIEEFGNALDLVDEYLTYPVFLYFFKQFQKRCEYPRKMLDANLSVDDSKLEYVAGMPGGRELILSLAEKGRDIVVPDIEDRFGLSEMLSRQSKDQTFIASFLYYFGVLTLAGETEQLQLILKVPNLVMQSLYVERVRRMMLPDPMIRDRGRLAAEKAYQEGDIAPVCAFVEGHLFTVFKNRDYAQANEYDLVLYKEADVNFRNATSGQVDALIALRKVIWSKDSMDMTDSVIAKMNNDFNNAVE